MDDGFWNGGIWDGIKVIFTTRAACCSIYTLVFFGAMGRGRSNGLLEEREGESEKLTNQLLITG